MIIKTHFKALFCITLFFISYHATAKQDPLPQPSGQIVLVVSGHINVKNKGDRAVFDDHSIRSFPAHMAKQTMAWNNNVEKTYTGISLEEILQRLDAEGRNIRLKTKNGEELQLRMDHLLTLHPILAYATEDGGIPQKQAPLILVFNPNNQLNFDEELTELAHKELYGIHRIIIET